ncbi:MAG: phosphoenolpyruvate synthase [Gammaproteobacteria bacterium]|nr:phosphoenolpyruvate synthase [Gammaproteobacteria bacterium]MDH3756546.1 phosphoenolpyruvate synthase [Gammaproteobacteria bacterium]MDH3846855.1 phosphoenolpyruvate synthase [Gammaproteobacteria bacterium]MDH3863325.1 phosphoenolpyruvate synthase [Gammaproteobacteria bacterium]MDH3953276.1 phosphoenolpyruvate synthase [Gammaproteobacteria bacterium]
MEPYVIKLAELGMSDVERVGGKNASLGEMISNLNGLGVTVPGGFATTATAYRDFLSADDLDARIKSLLDDLDVDDIEALTSAGRRIREWILNTPLPERLMAEIRSAWDEMSAGEDIAVAVRSSATAEDLPDASFAGQQETFLNVRGLDHLNDALHQVFASLFNDRAIAYRVHQGFDHSQVALSVGVQTMVRSDVGASGVIFTLDTESGFREAVFITSSYGLGETVVQGAVNPDEFYVYKPALRDGKFPILRKTLGGKAIKMIYSDDLQPGKTVATVDVDEADSHRFSLSEEEIIELAQMAVTIEDHYQRPMDIEWGKDGTDGKIYILQARPETVQSRSGRTIQRFTLKGRSDVIIKGRSIGQKIGSGTARVIRDVSEMNRVQNGDVLVSDMTDPDWEPVMKRAAAIVTNRGGRTCHAAIIARELGIPAVVGCGDATDVISDGAEVTVSCAEGDEGMVYAGRLEYERTRIELDSLPDIPVKIMMNVGNPDRAFDFANVPNRGVGLARLEFIINRMIGVHPQALLEYESLDDSTRKAVDEQMAGYDDPVSFFVDRLAEGVSTIAAAFAPEPVIVRMSDFKSNEYANLIGGDKYEPDEENPMLGFRGAARYVADSFRPCFEMECTAIRKVRNDMGLTNVQVMIPFVRTVKQAKDVVELMAENGLERGKDDLKIIMMSELPTNALLADQYLDHFDGMSIGSNDMTQLVLGLDRDSALVADLFDERDDAVKATLAMTISACKARGKYIGICGQGPSDHPDLARWLLDQGIESMSLNPDSVIETWLFLAGESV